MTTDLLDSNHHGAVFWERWGGSSSSNSCRVEALKVDIGGLLGAQVQLGFSCPHLFHLRTLILLSLGMKSLCCVCTQGLRAILFPCHVTVTVAVGAVGVLFLAIMEEWKVLEMDLSLSYWVPIARYSIDVELFAKGHTVAVRTISVQQS